MILLFYKGFNNLPTGKVLKSFDREREFLYTSPQVLAFYRASAIRDLNPKETAAR